MSPSSSRARWLGLALLAAAQLMLIVDIVVANVALPSIARDLGLAEAELPFTAVAYTLLFGSLLIVAGRLGDIHGRARVLRLGLAVFLVASALAALAPSPVAFFIARGIQGIGAALVSANALGVLLATFDEGDARNRALGVWAAVGSGGAVVGQLLGGFITDLFGWPWIFLINVPLAALAVMLIPRLVPETPRAEGRHVDWVGAGLLATSLGALMLGLARLPAIGLVGETAGLFTVAAVLSLAFVVVERRQENPVLPLPILRLRTVRTGNLVLAMNAGATVAALFFATLYLQRQLGASPLAVGAGFVPVTLIVLAVAPVAGRWIARVGAPSLIVAGGVSMAAGLLLLARVPATGSYLVDVLPGLALVALGNGLSFPAILATATDGVSERDQGVASGLVNTAQELGSAVGLTLIAAVATTAGASLLVGYRIGYITAAVLVLVGVIAAARSRRSASSERMAGGRRMEPAEARS